MIFSILFVSFAKSAIMSSTHLFTNSSNLTNLYVSPQDTPPSYLDSTPILGYQNLKKRTNKKRIKGDANLQTSWVKCEEVNEESINPNDKMPSECICQELLKNLCSRIINKINEELPVIRVNYKVDKLSEDIFTDYVEKIINKEEVTINSSVVKDYDFVLAEKTWFPIYLLSNKNFNTAKPDTLEYLRTNLIDIIKIDTYEIGKYNFYTYFYIDNYRNFLASINENFQVNDNETCALGNIIDERIKALDDEKKAENAETIKGDMNFFLVICCVTLFCVLCYAFKLWLEKRNNQQDNRYNLLSEV